MCFKKVVLPVPAFPCKENIFLRMINKFRSKQRSDIILFGSSRNHPSKIKTLPHKNKNVYDNV